MVGYTATIEKAKKSKSNPKPCHTPGCSTNCAYAYSCHEHRMGRHDIVFWPAVGLGLFLLVAVII
jgi:hypothetical protein